MRQLSIGYPWSSIETRVFFLGHLNLLPTRQWDFVVVFFVPSKSIKHHMETDHVGNIVCVWFILFIVAGTPAAHIPRINRRIDNKYRREILTKQALGWASHTSQEYSVGMEGKTSWNHQQNMYIVYYIPTISFLRANSLVHKTKKHPFRPNSGNHFLLKGWSNPDPICCLC